MTPLTKDDLQAIQQLVQQLLQPVLDRQEGMEGRQQAIQEHICTLAADVARMNHHIERKLDKVLEMVGSANERGRRLDIVETKLEAHEHRLFAVEEALRKAE